MIPLVTRYGLSASGPICISFAHFVAAVICLRAFPHSAFGLFSFAFVVVPFCLSTSGALIGAPAAIALRRGTLPVSELGVYLKSNLAFTLLAAATVLLLMRLSRGDWLTAGLFAAYSGSITLRWFARTLFYAGVQASRVLFSDLCYGLSHCLPDCSFCVACICFLPSPVAEALLESAAMIALTGFGFNHLRRQFDLTNFTAIRGLWQAGLVRSRPMVGAPVWF